MNHRKIYMKVIRKAQLENRKYEKGVHVNHHILPKSLFPLWEFNHPNNIVILTHREHFFCHQLARHFWRSSEMIDTVWFMCHDKNTKHLICKNSREYAILQKLKSEIASERWRGSRNPNKKGVSQKTIEKLKQSLAIYYQTHDSSNKNVPMSEEQKEKLRQANLGKKQSKETIEKRCEKLRGRTVIMTDEWKKALSEGGKGKTISIEHRKNLSKAIKGRKWYTNGVIDKMLYEPENGFYLGRTNFIYPKKLKEKK